MKPDKRKGDRREEDRRKMILIDRLIDDIEQLNEKERRNHQRRQMENDRRSEAD